MTGVSTSCGACRFLRRKCTSDCVFTPYFSYGEAALHFAAVHKVFGASNVSRLLLHTPEYYRSEAALSITYEALARMRDPVYGCVAYIYALQQEVANLQEEIEVLGNHMANVSIGNHSQLGSSQATNIFVNNSLQLFSQDSCMEVEEYWRSTITYQQEQVVSTHADQNRSFSQTLSNQMSVLQPQPIPTSEWQRQTMLGHNDPGPQAGLVEGVYTEAFDSSPWLIN